MKALALAAALAFGAQEPALGRFLVAKPQVEGFFAGTVIVLADHGATGSLGLVVNRPLERSLEALLPDLEAARGHDEPAFLGGPVAVDHLLLLVRASTPPPGAALVLPGVHVVGSREALEALLRAPPPGGAFRAYAGYAGWAPGQLEAEIARGDWLVAPGDAASVFTDDPAGLWRKLFDAHRSLRVEAPGLARPRKSITLSAPWPSVAASSVSRTSASPRSSTR